MVTTPPPRTPKIPLGPSRKGKKSSSSEVPPHIQPQASVTTNTPLSTPQPVTTSNSLNTLSPKPEPQPSATPPTPHGDNAPAQDSAVPEDLSIPQHSINPRNTHPIAPTAPVQPASQSSTVQQHLQQTPSPGQLPVHGAEPSISRTGKIDGLEYAIHGDDMQFAEITLDPGEIVVGESGALMFMQQGIQMQSRMSDASGVKQGVFKKLFGAAKRRMAGERAFMNFFTNNGNGKLSVGFSAPYPGRIVPLDLSLLGGAVLCQKDGFLCGSMGTTIGIGFTKRFGAMMFGNQGFILQKITGTGVAFVHAGGSVTEKELAEGETIFVDSGSIVGFTSGIDFNVKMVKGAANMFFGGESLFLSTLTGPGKVWIQSMPYYRLVGTINNTLIELNKGQAAKERKKMIRDMHKVSKKYSTPK